MNNFLLFIVTLFCWSPTWYVIKFQLGYVDPLVSVFYRFLIAGIVIFIYLIYKKKNLKFSFNQHLWFLLFGVCLYSLNYVFFYLSNTYLISAFPAIVFSTVVIMNILGEGFYFKKKPSLKTLIGAIIGMIGIIIIFNDEIFNFSLSNGTHVGLFLALLGTFSASTGNMVHQRNLNNNFSLIPTLAYSMLYGSLVTLLITQIKGTELLFEYTFSYIASLAYLSMVGSIFAFIFYLRLLEKVGAGRAGYVGVVMPVLALLISTIFENLEWQQDLIIGLPILIIDAALVINQKIKPIKYFLRFFYLLHLPIEPSKHLVPSIQTALLRLAPSKVAFKILAPVKSASKRLLLVKFVSINEAPLKFTLVKLALEKLAFSKIPPSRFASYKFVLIKEDSTKLPLANVAFIITPLSKVTLIKLINDRLEFGI